MHESCADAKHLRRKPERCGWHIRKSRETAYHIAILRQKLTLSDGENFEYQISISKDALKKLRDMYVSGLSIKTEKETE